MQKRTVALRVPGSRGTRQASDGMCEKAKARQVEVRHRERLLREHEDRLVASLKLG
jgi:hypothetical protein